MIAAGVTPATIVLPEGAAPKPDALGDALSAGAGEGPGASPDFALLLATMLGQPPAPPAEAVAEAEAVPELTAALQDDAAPDAPAPEVLPELPPAAAWFVPPVPLPEMTVISLDLSGAAVLPDAAPPAARPAVPVDPASAAVALPSLLSAAPVLSAPVTVAGPSRPAGLTAAQALPADAALLAEPPPSPETGDSAGVARPAAPVAAGAGDPVPPDPTGTAVLPAATAPGPARLVVPAMAPADAARPGDLGAQLGTRVGRMLEQAEITPDGVTRIALRPAGLGLIEMELSRDAQDRLHLAIRVQNPMVLAALRHDQVALDGILAAHAGPLQGPDPVLQVPPADRIPEESRAASRDFAAPQGGTGGEGRDAPPDRAAAARQPARHAASGTEDPVLATLSGPEGGAARPATLSIDILI